MRALAVSRSTTAWFDCLNASPWLLAKVVDSIRAKNVAAGSLFIVGNGNECLIWRPVDRSVVPTGEEGPGISQPEKKRVSSPSFALASGADQSQVHRVQTGTRRAVLVRNKLGSVTHS